MLDCRNQLGEGITWDERAQVLYWVDIPLPSRLHRWSPQTDRHDFWEMPAMTSALAIRERGGLLLATQNGLLWFDPANGRIETAARPEAHLPDNRSNDGSTDRSGRFWFGTMQNNYRSDGSEREVGRTGSLYRVDADLSVQQVETGIGIPNSTAFSPDGGTMYFCDTPTGTIVAQECDPDSGELGSRRVFSTLEGYGFPDGSTVDAEGFLWNARWEGGCVIRFDPDGEVDMVLNVPVSRVTCCAFGGPDLDTLYITTAKIGLSPQERDGQPQAGGLFAARPGPRGIAPTRFPG